MAKRDARTPRSKRPSRDKPPRVLRGSASVELARTEFLRRFRERFFDSSFDAVAHELDAVAEVAWRNYIEYHKNPRTKRAGRGFADPSMELPSEWLTNREQVRVAERQQKRRDTPTRILVINGSARSDQSCPGEISKSYRLAQLARRTMARRRNTEVDFLDLSLLTSEYGRVIYPCKACVSSAQPLCNWPCSCYPNHAMGQTQDWMHEIYPRWTAAHGVMIVTPVNWYGAPSVLKLMIDRLVCADGGNPDPTTTGGKDPQRAKALELAGWDYPKHLAGRAFAVVVHGDAGGVDEVRRSLCDWLTDLEMIQAGAAAAVGRYVGYYGSYATSHDDLDADQAFPTEVRNAARSLIETVRQIRSGEFRQPDKDLEAPRKK
ncbi:MAG: flavodoxin family protein [Planctomycetota bacterium]